MSILENNFSRHSKELAVCGYIRQYSIHEVPVAIIKLCLNYFDELFYISISGNALKHFLAMKNGERIEKIVKYNNELLFKYRIYPNGHFKEEKGNTLLFLRLSPIYKSKMSHIYFNFEINCNQPNLKHIGCGFRAPGKSIFFGWQDGFLKLLELKNDETLKNLIFSVFIDIIYIKYTNNITWMKPYKVNVKTTLIFKLNQKLKKTMKDWPIGKSIICHVSNDKCWMMNLSPKGFLDTYKGKPCVKCTFLKWCHKIKKIHFAIKTTDTKNNKCLFAHQQWEIDRRQDSLVFTLENNPFDTDKEMELNAEITILKIWDFNDHLELLEGRKHIEFGNK